MTVAQMRTMLDAMPAEAECFFTLWSDSGGRSYRFDETSGTKIFKGADENKQYANIAFTDNAPAYMLKDNGDGSMQRLLYKG